MIACEGAPTFLLREEVLSTVGSITSSDYNFRDHELVLTNGNLIQVYSGLASDDVQLRHTWHADDGEVFLRVIYVEWNNAVLVFSAIGSALHRRLLQSDSLGNNGFDDLGVLCYEGTLLDVAKNPDVHEVVTTDSLGGIRMWSIRGSSSTHADTPTRSTTFHSSTNNTPSHSLVSGVTTCSSSTSPPKKNECLRCPTRLHVQDTKKTTWHALCVDTKHQRIAAASPRAIKLVDALSGVILAKFPTSSNSTPPALVRRLAYVPLVDEILAFGPHGVDVWNVSNVKQVPVSVPRHAIHNALQLDDDTTFFHDVASCCVTHTPSAFATKSGLPAVVLLTTTSKLAFVPVQDTLDEPARVLAFQLRSLALPLDTVSGYSPSTVSSPAAAVANRKPYSNGFVFSNLQHTARHFVAIVQSHTAGSCLRVVEVLSTQSTSRMVSASTNLFSLREIPFTIPAAQQRDPTGGGVVRPRRGYSLFGGTVAAKSVQLFEDVALPVCELALPRHEGVDFPTVEGVSQPVICFLEYSTHLAKCIVGWSDGVLDLFSLNGHRWCLLKRPCGVMADCVCTLQLSNGVVGLVVGDAQGSLDTWLVEAHAWTYHGTFVAHSENIVSIQNPAALPSHNIDDDVVADKSTVCSTNNNNNNAGGFCRPSIVTTAFDGQIKLWEWTLVDENYSIETSGWQLVGLFKTHSINISVAKLVDRNHLCCGCEAGAVELWTLPRHHVKGATSLLTTKKAITFSPSAHANTVTDIAVHHNIGTTVDHDFTLLATLARDHTILLWYFAGGDICVPFRVVVTSAKPCGGYFSTAATPNAVSFLCCLGSGVDRVLVLPRQKKKVLALVLRATNNPLVALRPPTSIATSDQLNQPPHSIYHTDTSPLLYQPIDIPLQLTIPVVHMHMIPDAAVAEAVARLSPTSASHRLHNQPLVPTRHAVTVNLAHEREILGVPLHMSQSTIGGLSSNGALPSHVLSTCTSIANGDNNDQVPSDWVLNGQNIRRPSNSLLPKATAVPRAYRDISRRTNAPRVYRQPPPPPRHHRPVRARVVSAFGLLGTDEELLEREQIPHLQQRRHAITMPKATPAILWGPNDNNQSASSGVHVVELATRPPTNPLAPLFWLDAHSDRSRTVPTRFSDGNVESKLDPQQAGDFNVESLLIPWDDLSPEQQFIEIQASLLSKAVQNICHDAGIDLPPSCFNLQLPTNVPDRVLYHKYMFWYGNKAPHARTAFLRQELLFATGDADVIRSALAQGIAIPKRSDCQSLNSSSPLYYRWCRYVAWYCRGFVLQHHHLQSLGALDWTATPHYAHRLAHRTDLLKCQLHAIDVALQSFAALQAKDAAKQEATRNAATIMLSKLHKMAPSSSKPTSAKPVVLSPELKSLDVDFFCDIVLPDGQVLDFVPWESLTLMAQQKELALAMHDAVVRWQAMKAHVAIPQVLSVVAADDVDDVQLTNQCAAFITWWSTPHNAARVQFLKTEAHEAAHDSTVKAAASRAGVDLAFYDAIQIFTHHEPPPPSTSNDSQSTYQDWYFQVTHAADSARVDFLKQKMAMLHRQKRFELVVEMGRLPPPVLFCMTPAVLLSFESDNVPAVAIIEVADESASPADANNAERKNSMPLQDSAGSSDGTAAALERVLREQWEASQLVSNRKQMEVEDDAARLMRLMDDDGDDQDVTSSPRVRPARDFSVTYFFNTMPGTKEAAAVAASGWVSGCGLDNGDEEVEEREVREVERLRQLELDAVDRARIAEEERVAALLLAEQLREDERKAQKRARQVEVKRILTWQRDETLRRQADASQKRIERECAGMQFEEFLSRQWWLELDSERQHMAMADLESAEWARQCHELEKRRAAMLVSDRRHMLADDLRSRHAAEFEDEVARLTLARETFLRDLYTPFDPYFADSSDSRRYLQTSHTRQRRNQEHHVAPANNNNIRPMTQQAASKLVSGQYAVPFHHAVELTTPECEVYQAQPSHKFQALLGLPIQYRRPPTSHNQNVATSLDTLARSRSVPGLLPRPHTTTTPMRMGGSNHPLPSRGSCMRTTPPLRGRTVAFDKEPGFQHDDLVDPPTTRHRSQDNPTISRISNQSSKHGRRRLVPDTTLLAPLTRDILSNQQESILSSATTTTTMTTTISSPLKHPQQLYHPRSDTRPLESTTTFVPNEEVPTEPMYRQSSLPPPFFRTHLAVVGQKPTTAPSISGGCRESCSRTSSSSADPTSSLFVRVPHRGSTTIPRTRTKVPTPTSSQSDDYSFGRLEMNAHR
ncbi:hypothetical protein, variant [Aphanomyces astaci]|uniref:Uncharacterized protein n=1 Tax=Aphanomyces astaci TaxID=112090 RepID=W4FVG8_APHAT|nr:hypothetical protein, variant [Aphanomyces astaci]ETV70618.1 hypothetical protein, variant [Aphanomyces astaci]|eukprot:XP_009840001.1 hypothetical protein, variant [Aphanomyces astaci]